MPTKTTLDKNATVSMVTTRTTYNVDNNPEYMGVAPPGALTSDDVWVIRKIIYQGLNPIATLYANGDSLTPVIWDNRGTYTYL